MPEAVLGAILAAAVGGLLAIAGGFAANWFQMRITLRMRMNQLIAERKVSADADALKYLKLIESHLAEHSDAQALALMLGREDWLFGNRLFLPAGFAELWISLQTTLRWISEAPDEAARDFEDVHRLRVRALRYVKQAAQEIYHDMNFENGTPDFTAPA
jgi:hypothetical protein